MKNLLNDIPTTLPEELLDTLVRTEHVKIERIVSRGHTSPETGWYDQDEIEFVLLIKGAAQLEFANGHTKSMGPGDWLVIPAHRKHRVAWTEKNTETVWLAVHYP